MFTIWSLCSSIPARVLVARGGSDQEVRLGNLNMNEKDETNELRERNTIWRPMMSSGPLCSSAMSLPPEPLLLTGSINSTSTFGNKKEKGGGDGLYPVRMRHFDEYNPQAAPQLPSYSRNDAHTMNQQMLASSVYVKPDQGIHNKELFHFPRDASLHIDGPTLAPNASSSGCNMSTCHYPAMMTQHPSPTYPLQSYFPYYVPRVVEQQYHSQDGTTNHLVHRSSMELNYPLPFYYQGSHISAVSGSSLTSRLTNKFAFEQELSHSATTTHHDDHTLSVRCNSSSGDVELNSMGNRTRSNHLSSSSLQPPNRICAQYTVNNVTLRDLQSLFHLTLVDAVKHMGMCTTLFMKICRKNNILKWPYRQIHSLRYKIRSLERFLSSDIDITDSVRASYQNQINALNASIESVKDNAVVKSKVDNNQSQNIGGDCDGRSERSDSCSEGSFATDYGSSSTQVVPTLPEKDGEVRHGHKRKRYNTTYDYRTGWVAKCSTCGKFGKYRHPSEGRVFQHSSGSGKYCGYYRDDPIREEDYKRSLQHTQNQQVCGNLQQSQGDN